MSNPISHNFLISNEDDMSAFGANLQKAALANAQGCVIYLVGDLGAGKTTMVRGFIKAFGHQGAVKSPTYTLVEPYTFDDFAVHHFDFYRVHSARECEEMGIRDYLDANAFCFIEWPQKGEGFLPEPDLTIEIRQKDEGRQLTATAHRPKGEALLNILGAAYE